jgi:hypothetical protein
LEPAKFIVMPGPAPGIYIFRRGARTKTRGAITLSYRLLQFTVPVECALLRREPWAIASGKDFALHNARLFKPAFTNSTIHE